ncbi:hypothetical protein YB2330_005529 [Saitoella coloradoensis]
MADSEKETMPENVAGKEFTPPPAAAAEEPVTRPVTPKSQRRMTMMDSPSPGQRVRAPSEQVTPTTNRRMTMIETTPTSANTMPLLSPEEKTDNAPPPALQGIMKRRSHGPESHIPASPGMGPRRMTGSTPDPTAAAPADPPSGGSRRPSVATRPRPLSSYGRPLSNYSITDAAPQSIARRLSGYDPRMSIGGAEPPSAGGSMTANRQFSAYEPTSSATLAQRRVSQYDPMDSGRRSTYNPEGPAPLTTGSSARPVSTFFGVDATGPSPFNAPEPTNEKAQPVVYTRQFVSRRLKGPVEKPWLLEEDPREKWVSIIPIIGIVVGFIAAGLLIWDGIRGVAHHKYCPVLIDDFQNGLNTSIWTHDVELGGFGNGEFEWTTADSDNSYVQDGKLFIVPTLTNASLTSNEINNGYTVNLTATGECTSTTKYNCVITSNTTTGQIIPPIKSARLTTKASASIKYGRVEVRARLPKGDWIWPAIWMLPVNNTYGVWPKSGEIDIAESRGNDIFYPEGGRDIISSTLHWGPDSANDGYWRTNNKHRLPHTSFDEGFHTFGLEWSEKYLFTYVDSRLQTVLYTKFQTPFWDRGSFPLSNANGTTYVNPWSSGTSSTPFDQEFYLILNVAVGGTNGWFVDGKDNKPWVDASSTAMGDFWRQRETWLPTWGSGDHRAMVVDKVSMWQQCDN